MSLRQARWLLALIVLSSSALAQRVPPALDSPTDRTEEAKTNNKPAAIPPVALFVMLNRKSFVFPDIAVNPERLSSEKKFELFVDNSISLNALSGAAFGSGLAQAANTPTGFRQGGDGYAKRFGSSMARNASSNFFGTFVLASAFQQDPRFFPKRESTFSGAIKYSLQRVVITRNDEGRDVKNWSGLLGPLLSEGLANAYWPDQNRTAGQTFQRYGIDLAVRAGTNMLRQYWPTLFPKMLGVHYTPATAP